MTTDLQTVDDALVRLRRLWTTTPRGRDGSAAKMSSVLVVEACVQGSVQGGEVTVGDVARFADVEPSTASRLVDRAARNGFLQKVPSRHDARATALVLSPAGLQLREQAVAFRTAWLTGLLEDWSAEDVGHLAALLRRFATAVTAHGAPGQPPG